MPGTFDIVWIKLAHMYFHSACCLDVATAAILPEMLENLSSLNTGSMWEASLEL